MKGRVDDLFKEQFRNWKLAASNYKALEEVKTTILTVRGNEIEVQFNPARIVSSAAKVDAKSIKERACFLCLENRPAEQNGLSFLDKYTILINPFPIFSRHLTIPSVVHTPQRIKERIEDMLDLAAILDEYVVFYNGPRCGASAPDHFHFQAGNKGFLPFEKNWRKNSLPICTTAYGKIAQIADNLRSGWIIEGSGKSGVNYLFDAVYKLLAEKDPDEEPMLNLLAWYESEKWVVVMFPRKKHRPDCFYAEGPKQLMVSPASVDLGGVFITPLEKDFERITSEVVADILCEVCLDKTEEEVISDKLRKLL